MHQLQSVDISGCKSMIDLWGLLDSSCTVHRRNSWSLDVGCHLWEDFVLEVNGLGTLEDLTYLGCLALPSSACIAELGWLTNLQVVNLWFFRGDKLPDKGKLTNLRLLSLEDAMFLQRIELQNLSHLTTLYLTGCSDLQSMDISGCRSMEHVVELWSSRGTLEELNVSSCPLLSFWDDLDSFQKLRKLDITGCKVSTEELRWLGLLDELEELRAMQCDSLTSLPSCRLPKLRVLEIEPKKIPASFEWELGAKDQGIQGTEC